MQQKYKIGVAPHILNKPGRGAPINQALGWQDGEITKDELIEAVREGWAIGAWYDGGHRKTVNFHCADFVAADIDGTASLEDVQQVPLVRDHATFIYTTVSHTEDSERFRVVFLLDDTITVAMDWANCLAGVGVALDGDRSVRDAARMFYGNTNAEIIHLGGTLPKYEADRLIALGADQRQLVKLQNGSDSNAAIQAKTRLPRGIEVRQRNGMFAPLKNLSAQTPVHCPIHADENPSAMVVQSQKGSKGVWCATCRMTFWTEAPSGYDFDAFDFLVKERRRTAAQEVLEATNPLVAMFPPDPNIIEVQRKHLPPLTYEPGITLVKSPKGSGKTTAIAAMIEQIREQRFPSRMGRKDKSNNVLLIGHRRLLIREAALRLGIDCYLGPPIEEKHSSSDPLIKLSDLVDMPPSNWDIDVGQDSDGGDSETINHYRRRFGYAICLDSLPKIIGGPKYDTVIIDESEQVFSHLLSDTIKKNLSTTEVFAALARVLSDARSIYLLDADLGMISLHALKDLRPDLWGDRLRIVYNKPLEVEHRRVINLYSSRSDIMSRLTDAVAAGKRCFVASNSRGTVKTVAMMLRTRFGETLKMVAIDSDNSQNEDEARFIQNIQRDILTVQVVVCSPSLGTGIDITFPGGACEVDEVIGLFTPYVNKHTDIDQQLARVRNPGNVSVWFGGGFTNFETNTDVVRDHLVRAKYVPHVVKPFYNPSGQLEYDRDDPLLNLVTHVRVAQWASQNNIRKLFKKLRTETGWDINNVAASTPKNKTNGQQPQDPFTTAEQAVRKEYVDQVIHARELTDQEYIELSAKKRRGIQIRGDNRIALERATIERLWQKPVTKEMVEIYAHGAIIDKASAYRLVFEPGKNTKTYIPIIRSVFDPRTPLGKGKPHELAIRLMFTTPLIDNGELMVKRKVTKLDFSQFIEFAIGNRVILQDAFGTAVRSDIKENPVRMFNEYIRCFGIRLEESSRVTVDKKRLQGYQIDRGCVERMNKVSDLLTKNYLKIYPWLDRD